MRLSCLGLDRAVSSAFTVVHDRGSCLGIVFAPVPPLRLVYASVLEPDT